MFNVLLSRISKQNLHTCEWVGRGAGGGVVDPWGSPLCQEGERLVPSRDNWENSKMNISIQQQTTQAGQRPGQLEYPDCSHTLLLHALSIWPDCLSEPVTYIKGCYLSHPKSFRWSQSGFKCLIYLIQQHQQHQRSDLPRIKNNGQ